MYIHAFASTRSKIFYAGVRGETVLRLRLRRREVRQPFCPRCGAPWKNAGSRFVCPRCGFTKLTPAGKSDVERKLLAGLNRLLTDVRGDTVAVTFRKLKRAAELSDAEVAYARAQWRKLVPAEVAVNGSRWFQARKESERIIYKRIRAEVGA
jgi:ribosomal protein S27AE